MDTLTRILEEFPDEKFLKADGFDEAVIGVSSNNILVYSISKCIEVLQKDSEMSTEEAEEYFFYNVEGAYVGKKTPIFINLI